MHRRLVIIAERFTTISGVVPKLCSLAGVSPDSVFWILATTKATVDMPEAERTMLFHASGPSLHPLPLPEKGYFDGAVRWE